MILDPYLTKEEMQKLTKDQILTFVERGRPFLFEAHLDNGTIQNGVGYSAQYSNLSKGMTMQTYRHPPVIPYTYYGYAPSQFLNLWGAGYSLGDANGGRVHMTYQPGPQDAGYIYLSRDW